MKQVAACQRLGGSPGSNPGTNAVLSRRAQADGSDARPRALSPPRLDLRGKGRRLRILAYKGGERVRLVSRHGRDHTRRFRDIAAAVAKLSARSLVLDGEVAIYDEQLRSRFEWLREPDPDAVARLENASKLIFPVQRCSGPAA
jgi:hypothetical protein